MWLRQYLRRRRADKRIAADATADALLDTEEGRAIYLEKLQSECAHSSLINLLENALKLPGDVIECGVYRGASLRRIANTTHDTAPEKTVFGLDSFEGFPVDGVTEADTGKLRPIERLQGKFKDADDAPSRIRHFAQAFGFNIELRKGYFEATLPEFTDRNFCFLHIDCDTYAGHKEVLEALYDRIVPGGCIVFDDYNDDAWPGATKAADDFCKSRGGVIRLDETRTNPAWYIIKER